MLSAGILLYRIHEKSLQFFLVHPGGPFFARKNEGWWTVPKGELLPAEDPLAAAVREFEEETGYKPQGKFISLDPVVQKAGKKVLCWAVAGDLDPETITSNTFDLEWPPHSGKMKTFPEIDRAGWFDMERAKMLINEKQASFLVQISLLLNS